jgi:hypothetical protein
MKKVATPESVDVGPYEPDKVAALLKLATWYVRLRRPQKVERLLAVVDDLVVRRRGLDDALINRKLDDYARTFLRLNRPDEAARLADLAQRVRDHHPDQFYADGDDKPWWLQDAFLTRAPSLPVEYRSSHAADGPDWTWPYASAVLLFATFPVAGVLAGLMDWSGGLFVAVCAFVPLVGGLLISRASRRALERKGAESWVHVTSDGVEYHDPTKDCPISWSDVKHVWTSWVSAAGDGETHPSVVVVGERGNFEMSARFFTEQEVRVVNGLCKLHSGQATFADWRERPWR